ncbi:phosphatase PAP2 family protein [Caulobacter sp. UNC279MFTsu5.1]|uniref:acid phosphatase n=1 Tax=Caulobacter sp. UNC279MFTsu5.1 TaxID=1502775 RepID=UPI00037506F1|nr:phosphatase PAP2 family protein [Caulobacter sp. UNC279MFTsu5.1]SFJ52941.1 acid phosphatase (class A) [Caulobacter sp. UNC279MFTsu5.1]
MRVWLMIGMTGLVLAGCASLTGSQAVPYLARGTYDARQAVPPPPPPGSATAEQDRAVFLATRRLKDTPRWSLAKQDAREARIMDAYACALGVTPSRQATPRLAAMLQRLGRDARPAISAPKRLYDRKRPYQTAPGAICVRSGLITALTPDYPSGHATWGWTIGLVLAKAQPQRAQAILARARAYGESRVVCGVHNASSVEAGRINATALVAALDASPAFATDLAAVGRELDAARAAGPAPDPARCEVERATLAQPPY